MNTSLKLPGAGDILWSGTFEGRVNPLPRPRRSSDGHIWQPLENQRELRAWLLGEAPKIPLRQDLWLAAYFFFESGRKVDGDNLLKSVMDGLQFARFFKDDSIIQGGLWCKSRDTHSYAHIFIHEVEYYETPFLSDGSDRGDSRLS